MVFKSVLGGPAVMEQPGPTRINFSVQLKSVQRNVLRMGALVETSCQLARQAMFERDLEAADQIIVLDREIDSFYRQIEVDCVNLIALQSPVAQDLRFLSALMQLVRDIERIGDYAKNLGEVSVRLFPYDLQPQLPQLRIMFDRFRAMLAMGLKSLSDLDDQIASELQSLDDLVDADYENLYSLLTQKELQGPIEPVILMVLAIRHIERMADHSTNIGKRVHYIVTGER